MLMLVYNYLAPALAALAFVASIITIFLRSTLASYANFQELDTNQWRDQLYSVAIRRFHHSRPLLLRLFI